MDYLFEMILWLSTPLIFILSKIGLPERKLNVEHFDDILDVAKAGDILFSKRRLELSNFFNPNSLKHAAIYVGKIDSKHFVLEAVTSGVKLTRLEDFVLNNDEIAIYSPALELNNFIENRNEIIKEYLGRKYDYRFSDFGENIYCFELVALIYEKYFPFIYINKTTTFLGKTVYSKESFTATNEFKLVYSTKGNFNEQ